jgi:hypothetical protein
MRIVGWIYTPIVLAATIILARQRRNRDEQPILWLAILILASLRSPFLPSYAVIPAVWLLTLLTATLSPTMKRLCIMLLAWVVLNAAIPQLHPDPRLAAIALLAPQSVIVVLVAIAFRHWPKSSGAEVSGERRTVLADSTV